MRTRWVVLVMMLAVGGGVVPAGPSQGEPSPATFRLVPTGAHGSEVNLGITRSGILFFGGWDHVARSTDDGRTWVAKSLPSPVAAIASLISETLFEVLFRRISFSMDGSR